MLSSRSRALVATMAAALLVGCGGAAASTERAEPPAAGEVDGGSADAPKRTPDPGDRPTEPVRIGVAAAVGQRLITGYHGAVPTAGVLSAVHDGHVGGVILFGENVPTPAAARSAVRALQQAAERGHQPPLLVMVDQEGGVVRRLTTLPPSMSPRQMGAGARPWATARAQGIKTGRALRRLGIGIDLAPVADVPDGPSSFLGERAFSGSRSVVARGACGFADGLARGGVAGSLKHFPGLGRARGNTDLAPIRIAAPASALTADLAAYERCGKTVPMVMISSASYPALGINRPAVLAAATYRMLAATGFTGITITDAFDTPAIANQTRPALTALNAGADLLLYGVDESGAQRAYARLVEDARAGRLHRPALEAAARRILSFKRSIAAGKVAHG